MFIVIWLTFAYYPIAHMVWFWAGPDAYTTAEAAAGRVAHNGFLFQKGALDFAGGTVVHINAGIAGLVGCMLVGKRVGYGTDRMPPHNLPYVMIGSALLWVGWFGFNVGSNLEANGFAALVFTNTLLATAAATMAWMFGEWIFKGSPTMLGAASGAVAGLVAITPACGWVGPMGSIAIGAIAALICLWAVIGAQEDAGLRRLARRVRRALHRRHRRRAAHRRVQLARAGRHRRVRLRGQRVSGSGRLRHRQARDLAAWGVGTTLIWSGVVSLVAFKIVDLTIGLRVTEEQEREGLDTVVARRARLQRLISMTTGGGPVRARRQDLPTQAHRGFPRWASVFGAFTRHGTGLVCDGGLGFS